MGNRIVGPFDEKQAEHVAHELVEDKNLVCLMRRFLCGDVEPIQMSGEFQILCETTWTRIYGQKERRDIHDLRD